MQLVAYGAQDIYLTGNPMITYFKVVYRRHTNFAMESIAQTFNGTVGFGNKVTALVSRNGDLVSGITLEATIPNITVATTGTRWLDSLGHYLIREVSIDIGGQQIDKHYADWLEIWTQLSMDNSQITNYSELIGLDTGNRGLTKPAVTNTEVLSPGSNLNSSSQRVIYVPLQFWFCRNVGLALPLIALQYHEVKINVQFETQANLLSNSNTAAGTAAATGILAATLWVDYIYLDTDERRRFAQVSHEYLIEQLQFSGDQSYTTTVTQKVELTFNHPVKELIWVARETDATNVNQRANYTSTVATAGQSHIRPDLQDTVATAVNLADGSYRATISENLIQSAKLQLNGHDRFAVREGVYFNRVQPLKHHTRSPGSPGINVYSFALKPEDHQPSGTCNFSRIDNAQLVLSMLAGSGGGVIKVFAVNYNVLRIMSGMGGLAYSN